MTVRKLRADCNQNSAPRNENFLARTLHRTGYDLVRCRVHRCQSRSVTVVRGWRAAAALLMKRPLSADLFAERLPVRPPTESRTVVRGWRAAAALLMKRPLIADLFTDRRLAILSKPFA